MKKAFFQNKEVNVGISFESIPFFEVKLGSIGQDIVQLEAFHRIGVKELPHHILKVNMLPTTRLVQ
jgi:hypothetical protein